MRLLLLFILISTSLIAEKPAIFWGISSPLTQDDLNFIKQHNIVGILPVGSYFKTKSRVQKLSNQLRPLGVKVAIDQEGGRVSRIKNLNLNMPPMADLGEINDVRLTFKLAYALGKELKATGVDINFAPVADITTTADSKVIGDRSFSSDPVKVALHVKAYSDGLKEAGITPVIKHFPGHGHAKADSHIKLPVDTSSLDTINSEHLIPYRLLLDDPDIMIMLAHVKYTHLDPLNPASLSPSIVHGLKSSMGFKGKVITDDLNMGAIRKQYSLKEACNRLAHNNVDYMIIVGSLLDLAECL